MLVSIPGSNVTVEWRSRTARADRIARGVHSINASLSLVRKTAIYG
jgi:hypothetical protein